MVQSRVFLLLLLVTTAPFFQKNNKRHLTTGFELRKAFQDILPPKASQSSLAIVQNGYCDEYPHCFQGRFLFSPTLVRTSDIDDGPGHDVTFLSLFGYTLGGTVVLEYDESPVGPYNEFVTLDGLVTKRGAIGQWGSRLFVSTKQAADICDDLWGVPAEVASISLDEGGTTPLQSVDSISSSTSSTGRPPEIEVNGWQKTRILKADESSEQPRRFGNIPVLWTPTIKALWFPPWIPFPEQENTTNRRLPLHRLRLSASALRIRFPSAGGDDKNSKDSSVTGKKDGFVTRNLGLALIVDNVLIEISDPIGTL